MSVSEINKHFCIFGVGAIGGLITANLKKNGYNVSCIARGSTYEKISKNGITVISNSERTQFFPTVYKIDEEIPPIDYLFITVKPPPDTSMYWNMCTNVNKKPEI